MSAKSLSELAEIIADIDICMLSTHSENGEIATRPMSNNREVEYDGDSYYFTDDETRMVADIQRSPKLCLAFQGDDVFISVQGEAELIRDRARFEEHWDPENDDWFEDGIDTEGLVMIKVSASRITWWGDGDEGELDL